MSMINDWGVREPLAPVDVAQATDAKMTDIAPYLGDDVCIEWADGRGGAGWAIGTLQTVRKDIDEELTFVMVGGYEISVWGNYPMKLTPAAT